MLKNVLITGGTGSLGNALIKQLDPNMYQIGVYSRDEYKQRTQMGEHKDVRYIVGDVRDENRMIEASKGYDIIIHAAALKHVPTGEEMPEETVKTNILGTMNVIKAAKTNRMERVIYISTDKGSHPVNLYGMTKAVSEKLMVAANDGECVFACTRYGNVIGSRGSIIETLKTKLLETIDVTDERMTRFWMSLSEAVGIVEKALLFAKPGEIFIPKIRGMKIIDMFKAVVPNVKLTYSGMRPGEKLHECLVNWDESMHTRDEKDHFVIEPELFGVTYGTLFEYTSKNAPQLSIDDFRKEYL